VSRWVAVLSLAAVSALVVGCSSGGVARGKDGQVRHPTNLSVFDLRVGDCVVPPKKIKADFAKVRVVPCRDQHPMESFALVSYGKGDAYPGQSALQDYANAACLDRFSGYVGSDYRDSKLFYTYLLPSPRGWNEDHDRKVVCLLTTTGAQLTKSAKGSRM
jgi:hypothetical protein